MNLPNKLTMGRIFAIPVFIVVFLMGYKYAAAIIFILAALTDMLDGHIAVSYTHLLKMCFHLQYCFI